MIQLWELRKFVAPEFLFGIGAIDMSGQYAKNLGAQKVLLPLQQSGEIHAVGSTQALPYTKPWFLGVTALRGRKVAPSRRRQAP